MGKTINQQISIPESKLIFRLRQLKNSGESNMFVVSINPMTITIMGRTEILETVISGSGCPGQISFTG